MEAALERPLWAAPRKLADISTGVKALTGMLTNRSPAVLVRDFKSDEIHHDAMGRDRGAQLRRNMVPATQGSLDGVAQDAGVQPRSGA